MTTVIKWRWRIKWLIYYALENIEKGNLVQFSGNVFWNGVKRNVIRLSFIRICPIILFVPSFLFIVILSN